MHARIKWLALTLPFSVLTVTCPRPLPTISVTLLVSKIAAEGLCGLEIVEVSPPYDTSDITALMATRVIVDALGSMVAAGKLGAHRDHVDRPVEIEKGEYDEATHGRRWSTSAREA